MHARDLGFPLLRKPPKSFLASNWVGEAKREIWWQFSLLSLGCVGNTGPALVGARVTMSGLDESSDISRYARNKERFNDSFEELSFACA